jgi:hypothetical protein
MVIEDLARLKRFLCYDLKDEQIKRIRCRQCRIALRNPQRECLRGELYLRKRRYSPARDSSTSRDAPDIHVAILEA